MTLDSGKPIMTADTQSNSTATKQQLPETKFFYDLAMQRSAEIKTQAESLKGVSAPNDRRTD